MDNILYGWIILLVALVVVEAATTQLVTIWFAAGALAALVANLLAAPVWLQVTLFVVVSAVCLVVTRPLAKKLLNKKLTPTNADRAVGQTAVVIDEINNDEATGTAKVAGVVWTARSSDGNVIESGTQVVVDKIEGVKILVSIKNT